MKAVAAPTPAIQLLHRLGHGLGPSVGADMRGHAAQDGQDVDHVGGPGLARHADRQRLAGEPVHHAEHAELAAVPGAVLDEVAGPHVVGPLGARPDAGAVVQPRAAALGLPGRHLHALPAPEPAASEAVPRTRSTRLRFTAQPARRSGAVMRRCPYRP